MGEANQDVSQVIEVIAPTAKYSWLIARLVEFMASGSVLIFVTKKVVVPAGYYILTHLTFSNF